LRYPHRRVRLYDKDPIICAIWHYLIGVSPEEIRKLPLIFNHIDELEVPQEVKWLLGFWANRATVNPSKSPSKWMRQLGQQQTGVYWSAEIRERLARQVDFIRHWTVAQCSYEQIPDQAATWFIDAPYDSRAGEYYRYGRKDIDYKHLGEWCQSRSGQVIVCEQVGATWLDFRPFRNFKGLRGVSKEAIWTKTDESPVLLSPKSSNLISFPAANKDDKKHFWLTPPELRDETKAEFGDELHDPCPYPRPQGFDGLTSDWGPTNYVNPPFGSVTENGKKVGMTAWVRKAIAEQKKGKTSVIVYPMDGWVHLLLAAGAEMRSIGHVRWLATEDGSPMLTRIGRPIMRFVLRGVTAKQEGSSDATPVPARPDISGETGEARTKSIASWTEEMEPRIVLDPPAPDKEGL
jgi:hypothetical protein